MWGYGVFDTGYTTDCYVTLAPIREHFRLFTLKEGWCWGAHTGFCCGAGGHILASVVVGGTAVLELTAKYLITHTGLSLQREGYINCFCFPLRRLGKDGD